MKRLLYAMGAVLTVLFLSAALGSAAQDTFDPTGAWSGPCKSKDQSMGTLHVEFRREGRAWRAKGGLRTPGYPYSDSEFEEVKVDGPKVSFVGLWGPMVAEFTGAHKDAKLTGELRVAQDEKAVMTCAWVLTRVQAK